MILAGFSVRMNRVGLQVKGFSRGAEVGRKIEEQNLQSRIVARNSGFVRTTNGRAGSSRWSRPDQTFGSGNPVRPGERSARQASQSDRKTASTAPSRRQFQE